MSNRISDMTLVEVDALPVDALMPFISASTDADGNYIYNIAERLTAIESGTLTALLAAINAAGSSANTFAYYTGVNAVSLANLAAFALTLLDDSTASEMRTTLGLVIGVDVQAYSAILQTIAGGDYSGIKPPESYIIACSDETTAITTGTGKVTFRMPYAFTLTGVRASVTTAPTGSTIVIDINESGTTLLSTKLSIDASEKTSATAATAAVISDSSIADDAEITIDFDQVGATIAGAGVKVTLLGHRT